MEKNVPKCKIKKHNKNILLFVNGPYQLIVGLACIRKYIPEASNIEVIGYDMRWQKSLRRLVREFAQILDIAYREMPLEFKKSDSNYKRTYFLRSIWNLIVFELFVKVSLAQYIFIPKLFNNPERAIANGASQKNIFIYDDGIGLYVERIISFKPNKYIRQVKLRRCVRDIIVCPSNPKYFDSILPLGFLLNSEDYTNEIRELFFALSNRFPFRNLEDSPNLFTVFLCVSRISLIRTHHRLQDIHRLIDYFGGINKNIRFLIKPHPRDNPKEVADYFIQVTNMENCRLLPPNLWSIPVEILVQRINARIVVSGVSTIALNEKFFPHTKIIISGVLGEQRSDLSVKVIRFLEKFDFYTGDNLDELIRSIKLEFDIEI